MAATLIVVGLGIKLVNKDTVDSTPPRGALKIHCHGANACVINHLGAIDESKKKTDKKIILTVNKAKKNNGKAKVGPKIKGPPPTTRTT